MNHKPKCIFEVGKQGLILVVLHHQHALNWIKLFILNFIVTVVELKCKICADELNL